MTYAEKLKHPKWQKRRLCILERDNWMCSICQDEDTELHVHHLEYNKEPWDALDEQLQTLCKCCHKMVERYKTNFIDAGIKMTFKPFKCSQGKLYFIYAHGGVVYLEMYIEKTDTVVELVELEILDLIDLPYDLGIESPYKDIPVLSIPQNTDKDDTRI